jgi:hypothetical protein
MCVLVTSVKQPLVPIICETDRKTMWIVDLVACHVLGLLAVVLQSVSQTFVTPIVKPRPVMMVYKIKMKLMWIVGGATVAGVLVNPATVTAVSPLIVGMASVYLAVVTIVSKTTWKTVWIVAEVVWRAMGPHVVVLQSVCQRCVTMSVSLPPVMMVYRIKMNMGSIADGGPFLVGSV